MTYKQAFSTGLPEKLNELTTIVREDASVTRREVKCASCGTTNEDSRSCLAFVKVKPFLSLQENVSVLSS